MPSSSVTLESTKPTNDFQADTVVRSDAPIQQNGRTDRLVRDVDSARYYQDVARLRSVIRNYRGSPPESKSAHRHAACIHALHSLRSLGISTNEILDVYEDHFQHDLLPSLKVYNVVLSELSQRSMDTHAIMLKQQLQNNLARLSRAARMWSDGRTVDTSTMKSLDAMSQETSLVALKQQSDEDYASARRILGTLGKNGKSMDLATLNSLLACAAVRGDIDTALSVFGFIEGNPVRGNSRASSESFKDLLLTYARAGEKVGMETVFDGFLKGIGRAEKRVQNQAIWTGTVSELLETEKTAEDTLRTDGASPQTGTMIDEDAQVWNAMIHARLVQKEGPAALELLESMMAPGRQTPNPTASTLLNLIRGFAEMGDLEAAFRWANRIHTVPTPSDLPTPPKLKDTLNTIIAISGDIAAIQNAAMKASFLTKLGLHIQEFFDKADADSASSLDKAPSNISSSSLSSHILSSVFSDQSLKSQTLSITPPPIGSQIVAKADRPRISFPLSNIVDKGLLRLDSNPMEMFDMVKEKRMNTGTSAHPETLARLIEKLAHVKEATALQDTYHIAHESLSSLPNRAAETSAWAYLEDRMLIAMAHLGELEKAAMHRDRLLQAGAAPSADAYAAMIISARDTTDDATVALELFEEARQFGVIPNLFLFNIIISKLSKARRTHLALTYFEQMKAIGIKPSTVTYGSVIAGEFIRALSLSLTSQACF